MSEVDHPTAAACAALEDRLAQDVIRTHAPAMGEDPTLVLSDVSITYHPHPLHRSRRIILELHLNGSHCLATEVAVACVDAATKTVQGFDAGGGE